MRRPVATRATLPQLLESPPSIGRYPVWVIQSTSLGRAGASLGVRILATGLLMRLFSYEILAAFLLKKTQRICKARYTSVAKVLGILFHMEIAVHSINYPL